MLSISCANPGSKHATSENIGMTLHIGLNDQNLSDTKYVHGEKDYGKKLDNVFY